MQEEAGDGRESTFSCNVDNFLLTYIEAQISARETQRNHEALWMSWEIWVRRDRKGEEGTFYQSAAWKVFWGHWSNIFLKMNRNFLSLSGSMEVDWSSS